jgi:hypothetical protein
MYYILSITTTLFSILIFNILSALNTGATDTEIGLYVFVCWFFVFVIGSFCLTYLPKKFRPVIGNFSISLMIDGVLIFTGTLFVMWAPSLLHPQTPYDFPTPYFSLFYFAFATLVKIIAKKKYIVTILKVGVTILCICIAGALLPLPSVVQGVVVIFAALDVVLLIGTVLYFLLNRLMSDLGVPS